MRPLAELLSAIVEDESDKSDEVRMDPEAQIMELRNYVNDYRGGRFKVGDLITPRACASLNGAGKPHIVLEVRKDSEPYFGGAEVVSNAFGRRLDIRVASVSPYGRVVMHWAESVEFIPYHEPA